jgi:uncharacterized alpha-E superfamily protein
MIPRIAGNCFWLARYLERAENNARMLRMAERHSIDPECVGNPIGLWSTALEVGGTLDSYLTRVGPIERDDVVRFMVLDRENTSGIVACFKLARDNARTAKHLLTDFYWDAISGTWHEAEALDEARIDELGVEGIVSWSIERCRLVRGASEDLLRDTLPHVLALGEAVERADFTARILAEMLPTLLGHGIEPAPIGSVIANRWKSLLLGLGLMETWRREPDSRLEPLRVLELVLLHETSPHSLLVNTQRMHAAIEGFSGHADSASCKTARELEALVRAVDIAKLAQNDVRPFIATLTTTTNQLGLDVFRDHFE